MLLRHDAWLETRDCPHVRPWKACQSLPNQAFVLLGSCSRLLGKSADELFSRGLGKFYIWVTVVGKELEGVWGIETLGF